MTLKPQPSKTNKDHPLSTMSFFFVVCLGLVVVYAAIYLVALIIQIISSSESALTVPLAFALALVALTGLVGIYITVTRKPLTRFLSYILDGYVAIVCFAIMYLVINIIPTTLFHIGCMSITGSSTSCIINALVVISLSPFYFYTLTLILGFVSLAGLCWQIVAQKK